jgi:hypothetical protein
MIRLIGKIKAHIGNYAGVGFQIFLSILINGIDGAASLELQASPLVESRLLKLSD